MIYYKYIFGICNFSVTALALSRNKMHINAYSYNPLFGIMILSLVKSNIYDEIGET